MGSMLTRFLRKSEHPPDLDGQSSMSKREIDVADVEHIGAMIAGGLLLMAGYRKSGAIGQVLKAGGWTMLMRGQKGYRRLYNFIGVPSPSRPAKVGDRGVRIQTQIVVRRSPSDLYRIWRNLENLPVFMDHLLSVRELDDTRTEWVARAPAGLVIKWESEIVRDIENELIVWRSLAGSGLDSAGSVHFESLGPNITLIKIRLKYAPPADILGVAISKIFHCDPEATLEHDLRRFKAMMELEGRPRGKPGHPPAICSAI